MKSVEIRKQVRIPLSKCFELVLSGVRYRLFRAAITVVIISLASAFLTTMLTEGVMARDVGEAIRARTSPRREFDEWVSRVRDPLAMRTLSQMLPEIEQSPPRRSELVAWGELSDEELSSLVDVARRKRLYLAFFDSLSEGNRRVLVGRATGVGVIIRLGDEKAWTDFQEKMKSQSSQLPTTMAEFKTFLDAYKTTTPLRERIIAGHWQALAAMKKHFGQYDAVYLLAEAGDEFPEQIRPLGFYMSPDELDSVRHQARISLDAETIRRMSTIPLVKQRLSSRLEVKGGKLSPRMLWLETRSASGAKWLSELFVSLRDKMIELEVEVPRLEAKVASLERWVEALSGAKDGSDEQKRQLKVAQDELTAAKDDADGAAEELKGLTDYRKAVSGFKLSAQRIKEVAWDQLDKDRLARMEAKMSASDFGETGGGILGFSGRTLWLMMVSVLVCIVGITNAMLMSVTERFREIATMKCLGATDGFVMTSFVIESCLQGLTGGIIGVGIGWSLGVVRSWATFGTTVFQQFPGVELLKIGGLAVVAAMVISAMAAVYPAWVAARLAPMEAMRIE